MDIVPGLIQAAAAVEDRTLSMGKVSTRIGVATEVPG